MERSLRIGVDFDGVIADCTELKLEQARTLYRTEIPPHRAKEYMVVEDGIMTREEYRALMKIVCGTRDIGLRMAEVGDCIEHLSALRDNGHQLVMITSRDGDDLVIAKEWLAVRKMDLDIVSVGYGKDKVQAANGLDVYIDDDLIKLKPLVGLVPHLFLYSQAHNASHEIPPNIRRVDSWEEFIRHLPSS